MRFALSDAEVADLSVLLAASQDPRAFNLGEKLKEQFAWTVDPVHNAYRVAALKHQVYGELEVDDDAVVSLSDDGAYVMGWIWVDEEELETASSG